MIEKRPLGITLIGCFYIFGVIVLMIILLSNTTQQYGIAVRFGLPNAPENLMRALVAVISLIMAYGYLRLKKWGFWLMLIYTIYFLGASVSLAQQYKQQLFYGNVIWSIVVLAYTLRNRKCFNGRVYPRRL
jgi:hypothetical protein